MTMQRSNLNFTAHPWHGVSLGEDPPTNINAFIEIVPTDHIKYEVDNESGILMVDRPQKYSSIAPALYGFVPRTYCAEKVAELAVEFSGSKDLKGDGDPLDICVLSERPIMHAGILVRARPIGGLCMLDKGEADDKIIAVMDGDDVYGWWKDISDAPKVLIERIRHYFLTYKNIPDTARTNPVTISKVYGREDAYRVIHAAIEDYNVHYGEESSK